MGAYLNLVFKSNKIIKTTLKIAPSKFAKTSNTSACLVMVNNPCAISILIPKKTENRKEIIMGFRLLTEFVFF